MGIRKHVMELIECGIIRQALERGNPEINKDDIDYIIASVSMRKKSGLERED